MSIKELFKEVSKYYCLQFFTYPGEIIHLNSKHRSEINIAARVFSPQVCGLFLHSITFLTAYWKPEHFFEHLRSLIDLLLVLHVLPII